ncbi:MAG: hypothetical protein WCQ20_14170 [Synechococcaceae cyanobacterium ELA739]
MDTVAGSRDKETGGTKDVALAIDLEIIDPGDIGQHQLGLALLLDFAINGRTPGRQQCDITKPDTTGMIDERLMAIRVVPTMNLKRQKRTHHATEINRIR